MRLALFFIFIALLYMGLIAEWIGDKRQREKKKNPAVSFGRERDRYIRKKLMRVVEERGGALHETEFDDAIKAYLSYYRAEGKSGELKIDDMNHLAGWITRNILLQRIRTRRWEGEHTGEMQ